MSEVNITPWLGLNIPGYLNLREATGVKDDLYAKAIVFCDEDRFVGLVSIDALDLELVDVKRLRKRISLFTGIKEENIMVSLTHTHTGGPVVNCFVTKRDEEYVNYVVKKSADAVILAYNNMEPSKIGTGRGYVDNIAFNRRYFMKDGSVKTNPGVLNPNIDKPAGPIDPDVLVMKIEDMDGNILGAVVNFACHLDVVGGNEYCADYAGELSKTLKSFYGKDFITLFLTGLSGNINHINPNETIFRRNNHYKKMGRVLAGETIKVLSAITCNDGISINSKTHVLSIPLRTVSQEEIEKSKQTVNTETTNETDKVFANEILEFAKISECSTDVEIQVIRVGDTTITGFPGDVFVEFGLRVKEESQFKYNFTASHTNGRNGYIPVKEAFAQGGYEVRTTRSNKLSVDAGNILTETVLKTIQEELSK